MKSRRLLSALVLSLLLVAGIPSAVAADGTVRDVTDKVMCMCGCTLVLENCTHVECGVREGMIAFTRQQLDEGQSPGQIIQLFVAQYGEEVLSAPPKQGFNLFAWVLPFVAIAFAGGVIYFALKKWVRRGQEEQPALAAGDDERDEAYRARLERELSEFSEGGFR